MKTRDPFGKQPMSWVDRFGIYLSLRAIQKFLPKQSDLAILDLGCGYQAKLLSALQPRIKTGVGVDFSIHPELKNQTMLFFIESAIESALPTLTDNTFDVIMLISVLEHLPDPACVLEKCHQLLKPGGIFLINVPTWRGKFFLEFSAFTLGTSPKEEMDDHKMYYDKRDLWPLLVTSGFKPSQLKLRYHKFGLNLFAVAAK